MPCNWKYPAYARLRKSGCSSGNGHPLWAIGVGKVEGREIALAFTDGSAYEYHNANPADVAVMLADPYNSGCVFIAKIRFNPFVGMCVIGVDDVKDFTWTKTGRPSR